MASFAHVKSLSDSSSDEEDNVRPSFSSFSPRKRKHSDTDDSTPSRHTVIVSPNKTASGQESSDEDSDDDDLPSVHKKFIKPKQSAKAVIDPKAKNMMAKMGFKEGAGLGKNQQGRVNPIEVSKQRGRRGLGMEIKGLEPEDVEWDSSKEIVVVEETVTWFPTYDDSAPTTSELAKWAVEGPKKLTIDDETDFCDREVLVQVLECKSIFDRLEPEELRRARTRSNPFETIRGVFFLNRAAMKMANMDAVFDFMFTSPRNEEGESVLGPEDVLYFADVCAGPGGFSEYVLWRKKWEAKGFGFTLKGSNDFKLEDFHAAPSECFEPHYGKNGVDGNGDVYDPENIEEFRKFVHNQTDGKGVHFMMADGGFSVEGQENIQEILSKQLYLCQCLVALSIVRTGGHFVCKLFDVFTPFSAGLVYLMYRSFKQVSIHKPNTSRPANSERYIICKWKRDDCDDVRRYLFDVNLRLNKLKSPTSKTDVMQLVPLGLMKNDDDFYDYLFASNNVIGMRQVVNLAKIAAFCKDSNLREDRQSELKKQSLDFWKIPDKARTGPPRSDATVKVKELMGKNSVVLNKQPKMITDITVLQENVKSVLDWRCAVLGLEENNPMLTFYLGLGRNNVFRYDQAKSRWHKVTESIELARDTLIYGELILELRGEGRSQKRSNALHIIDAVYLGGVDVSQLHFKERHNKCRKYAMSINKPSRTGLVPLRVKEIFKLGDFMQIFHRLVPRIIKNAGCQRLVFTVEESADQRCYLPSGLMFYTTTKHPWMLALSKSSGNQYWFNVMDRSSVYECPKNSITSFHDCHNSRLMWSWKKLLGPRQSSSSGDEEMSKEDFTSFVSGLYGR